MFSAQLRIGRLVEIRLAHPLTSKELRELAQQMKLLTRAPPRKLVCCSDLRRIHVLAPEAADRLRRIMNSDNAAFERIGILLGGNAVVALQLERMVREAGNPMRRTFREQRPLDEWITPLLDPAECVEMRRFLAEEAARQPSGWGIEAG